MFKTLEERLAKRQIEHAKFIASEHQAQRFIDQFPPDFFTEKDSFTVYENSAYFYLYPDTIERAELVLVPALSKVLGPHWGKNVEMSEVTYHIYQRFGDYQISVRITPRVEGTCRIIAKATGKVTKRSKYVEVEEPEVEYFVDCGGDDNG